MSVERLISQLSKAWAPPPKLTVSEWADEFRYLSSESGAAAGKWHTLPFQRAVFDAFSDPAVHTIVVMSATQMVKTVFIENSLGYIIDRDPGPTLLIVPRDSDGEKFSKIRLAPMLRDTPRLRDKVADVKTARTTNTLGYKAFSGGHPRYQQRVHDGDRENGVQRGGALEYRWHRDAPGDRCPTLRSDQRPGRYVDHDAAGRHLPIKALMRGSSAEERRAHNPECAGSIPAPAPNS